MRVLGVIPARGGSKGVPRKNVRTLLGKPMIAYTIEAALAAHPPLSRLLVSTDNDEIADISRQYGADVPFMRPAELATDKARSLPVIQHAVRFVETQEGRPYEWVLLLQPTTPLREAQDIQSAIALAALSQYDSIISVVQVYEHHPSLMKRIEDGLLLPFCVEEKEGTRRQDYSPAAYMRNGAIYLTRRDVLMERDTIWGERICPYVMPRERSVNIDDELDLIVADRLLRQKQNV